MAMTELAKEMSIADIESNLIASAEDLGNYQDPKFDPLWQAIRSAIHAITEARIDRDALRVELDQALDGTCRKIVRNTFVACGEGGNYCSEVCRLRAVIEHDHAQLVGVLGDWP